MASGNGHAMSYLYQRYARSIFTLAWHMTGDKALAEDITQEVFIKIWQKSHTFSQIKGSAKSWVNRITANTCIDKLRKQQDLSNMPETLEMQVSTYISPDQQVISSRAHDAVQQALMMLPERQRLVISLTVYADTSNAETAQIMNISVQAAESLLARARRSLKETLETLNPQIVKGAIHD